MVNNHALCQVSIILGILALVASEYVNKQNVNIVSGTPPVIPIDDWIRQFGYPVENHEIETEDGYLLTYHRIPYGKNGTSKNRPIAFVQHGVGAASPSWVAVNQSLGFVLADAGFDVWMGNARGVEFSRKHVKLDPVKDKKKFWDFSWHEMGYYDLPAAIDYMLQVTGQSEVFYVGHSMGTTMYFVLGATRPEYMDKIKASVLMAPVAYIRQDPSPVWKTLIIFRNFLSRLYKLTGTYEVLPYNDRIHSLVELFCSEGPLQIICRNGIYAIVGWDDEEFDRSLITTYLQYLPGGTSAKTLEHFGQIVRKDFREFDYGFWGNIGKYHSPSPPTYDLSKVTSPLYIHYAPNDLTVVPQDVLYTVSKLPNVVNVSAVAHSKFNHADFMWATHVKSLVYDLIVNQLLNHR